ncbi:MAG: GNAT family N-acetyltransferase [Gammaproteobacteria bacterium]
MRKPDHFDLSTERLTIRPWRPSDRLALERMVEDSDMMRHLTHGRAWSADEVDEFLERQSAQLAAHGVCMGPMMLRGGTEIVGVAGIQPLDLPGEFELGWWVWKAYWGLGYALEAARALAAFATNEMGLARVFAVIDPDNAASIRVAEKIGMRFERRTTARETAFRREDIEVVLYVTP